MYTQVNKAGIREYIFTLFLATVAFVASALLGDRVEVLTNGVIGFNLAGNVFLFVFLVLLVLLIYNHYASTFSYKLTKKHIVIEKKTGSRVTEYDIPLKEITKAYIRRRVTLKGRKLKLSKHFFMNKKSTVLIVGAEENIVIFEPDDEFVAKLKEYLND